MSDLHPVRRAGTNFDWWVPHASPQRWSMTRGESPIVAAAIHAGHALRAEVSRLLSVEELVRLREEDPYTDAWTEIADNRVVVHVSRFEVDLNRPREQAVYLEPEDAWGIEVWRMLPPRRTYEESLALFDLFYEQLGQLLDDLVKRHGRIVVLDLHSYCYRRAGPDQREADPDLHPEINLGTGSLDRRAWGPLVDRFVADLRHADVGQDPLDVRENVNFRGGYFPGWINHTFGASACALAIEVKKTFMDEWTGGLDVRRHRRIGEALRSTIPGLLEMIG